MKKPPNTPLYMRQLFVAAAHNLHGLLETEALLECQTCGEKGPARHLYLSAWGTLICRRCGGEVFLVRKHPEGAKECDILVNPNGLYAE